MSTLLDEILKAMEENSIDYCNLNNRGLSPEDAKRLAEVLERNTSVKELILGWNNIGNEGAIAIAEALSENRTLVKLHLGVNGIGNRGAIAIANALKENTTLVELSLSSNNIGKEGAIAIGNALRENKTLVKLYMICINIGKEGAIAIAEALRENDTLAKLFLTDNNIGNEGAIAIGNALWENKTLVELDLHDNDIGNEGATAIGNTLSVNKTLMVLNLGYNDIGDGGCSAIAGALRNRQMQLLYLNNCGITDKGLISIAESLKENFSPTSLVLSNYKDKHRNVFTDEGANALLAALDINMALRYVHLEYNGVSDELQEQIKNKTERNKPLNAKLECKVSDLQGKSVPFRKTKIILLGDYGSGKTRTVRELTSEEYVEERDRYTEALEINCVNSMTWEKDDELNDRELSLASLRGQQVAEEVRSLINKGGKEQVEENRGERLVPDIDEEAQRSSFTSRLNSLSKNSDEEKKSLSGSDERTIVADIYDFGGHEVYRVVSQFFMNDWAVYLIVLNLEDELHQLKSQLSYYVSVVQTFAPEARIFIVGTHFSTIASTKEEVEEMIEEVKEEQATEKIVEIVFYIENEFGSGITSNDDKEALKTEIKKNIQRMLREKEPKVPLLWSRMLDNLRKKRESEGMTVVKVDDLRKLENPSIVKFPLEDIDAFIERMKEMGMLYHFDTPEELSNYVILDPNWLVEGMKGVVTIKEAKKLKKENPSYATNPQWREFLRSGVITSQLLELIASVYWKGIEEWKSYFMNLLQQQSLLYKHPDRVEEYIVPPLLPKNPPKPLPEMSEFLTVKLNRCYPPLEVYKLSFGLVKARIGWTYDGRSTRSDILLSKKVEKTRVFLYISCDAKLMRQEITISISSRHLKSFSENRTVMNDLLRNPRYEIKVKCPQCDKECCEYVPLLVLLNVKEMECEAYGHSIVLEDLFGSASGQGGESNEVDINFKLLLKIVGSKLSAANIDAIAQEYGLPVGECNSVAGLLESLYDLRNIGPDNLNVLLRSLETEEETLAARNSVQKYIDERTNANLGVDGGDIRTPSANNVEQSTAVTNTHIPREQEVMKKSNGEKLDYLIKNLNAVKEDTSETREKVNAVKEDTSETREKVNAVKEDTSETHEKVNAVKEDTSETREKVNAVKEDTSEILEKLNDLLDDVDFIIEDNQEILELLEKNYKKLNKLLENTEPLIKSTLNDSTFLSIDIRENDKEGKRLNKIISNDESVVYLLVKGKTIYFKFSAYVNNFVVEKVVSVEIGRVMKLKFKKNVLVEDEDKEVVKDEVKDKDKEKEVVEDNVKVNRYLKPVPISSESCPIGEDCVNVYKFSVDWSTTEGSIIAELEPKSIIRVEFIFKFKLEEKSDPVEYRIAINFKIFKENSKMPVNTIKRTLASVYDDIPTPVKILLLGTSRYTAMKTGEDLAAFLQHETLHLAAGAFHSVIENATKETAKGAFKMPKMLLL